MRDFFRGSQASSFLCVFVLLSQADGILADTFSKAYASSSGASLTEWGRRYENGEGVIPDVDRAVRLYCKAARQGYAEAQYRLGWIYSHGRGVKRDDALASAWFTKAASQNHVQSRNLLRLLKVKPKGSVTCPSPGKTTGFSEASWRPRAAPAQVSKMVHALAPEFRLPADLVLAVIKVESNFNSRARSSKNAQGLMQLIPETAKRFGVQDVWDPEQNLRGGMAYLRWLLDYFGGDLKMALAGYNAGEGAVQRYKGIPPYEETKIYVQRITSMIAQ